MKFWLLVFVFTPGGDYLWKDVIETPSVEACYAQAQRVSTLYINSGNPIATFCVSNDHWTGVKQDENVPYDFGDYQGSLNPIDRHDPDE
jgi:hypothetical protein